MSSNEQLLEMEIQACGLDKVQKFEKFWNRKRSDDELFEIVKLLSEQAFIEGRDSGITRSDEIIRQHLCLQHQKKRPRGEEE